MRRSVPLALCVLVGLVVGGALIAVAATQTTNIGVGNTRILTCNAGQFQGVTVELKKITAPCVATTTTTTTVPPTTTTTTTTTTVPPTTTTTIVPPTTTTQPPVTGWPDATNTGWQPTGQTLTVHSGNFTTSSNGQIITGLDVTGRLIVNHSGVVFQRGRIRLAGSSLRLGVVVQDTEFGYQTSDAGDMVTSGDGYTLRRVNIHGFHEGPRVFNTTVEDSWLHDFRAVSGDHTDGFQRYAPGSTANDVIRHNVIALPLGGANTTAGVWYADDWRGTLQLHNNLFIGGAYGARFHESGTFYVTGNRFQNGSFGATAVGRSNQAQWPNTIASWSDNQWTDGTVINMPTG